jgi:hypothetical protein
MSEERIAALEKRIAELEAEVTRLKAWPQAGQHVTHSHYHYGAPAYIPQPTWAPGIQPWPMYPQITYGAQGGAAG